MATETPNLPEQLHSRPGTDVATRPGGGTDSATLDAGDILIPRMKIAQKISRVVDDELVEYGAVYVLDSRDDMEPTIIAKAPAKDAMSAEVRFYIHGDPRKGWSWTDSNGDLGRGQQYPSLSLVEGQDPRKVRRTYDYLVTVIGYDALPIRFLMHGQWGGQAAKQLNTQLLLLRQKGLDTNEVAFKMQTKKTSSPKGGQERPFVQAIVGIAKVAAKDKSSDLELVQTHREIVGGGNVQELDDSDTVKSSQPVDAPSLD